MFKQPDSVIKVSGRGAMFRVVFTSNKQSLKLRIRSLDGTIPAQPCTLNPPNPKP